MVTNFSIKKLTLSAHITFSVAWFGAIAGFLVLAIEGLISPNSQTIRSSYIAMELVGWYAIVPFCIASLITGLVQSYISPWGLFRYYWVTVKFILTILSTIILFVHMKPLSYVASVAMESTLNQVDLRKLRIQLLADASAAMLVLLIIIALSVYKPWGKLKENKNQQSKISTLETEIELKSSKPWCLSPLNDWTDFKNQLITLNLGNHEQASTKKMDSRSKASSPERCREPRHHGIHAEA